MIINQRPYSPRLFRLQPPVRSQQPADPGNGVNRLFAAEEDGLRRSLRVGYFVFNETLTLDLALALVRTRGQVGWRN